MADVTGPISTLAGAVHNVPDGMMCDEHPDRPAVVRIQGETDSFGCEMEDLCQECSDERRAYRLSEAGQAEEREWRTGACEWCNGHSEDLRDARDYDEGMNGRVYRVCGACIKRVNDEAAAELDAMGWYENFVCDDDDDDDFDAGPPDEDEDEPVVIAAPPKPVGTVFRVHFTDSRVLDVEADKPDQARKIASGRSPGIPIAKVKVLKEPGK